MWRQLTGARFKLRHLPLIVLLASLPIQAPARAQLLLPGALQASPSASGNTASGNTSQNPAGTAPGKPKPAGLKLPAEETILGHELSRDGLAGAIAFQRAADKTIKITRLSLAGEAISHPSEPCRVDVVADAPIQTRFAGRPKGVSRYDVEIAACPFSFDVLDGAIIVTRVPPTCDFPAADCRAAPAGLWGPPGNSFGPSQVKQLERERSHAESIMRTEFRTLLSNAGKDKDAIKKIVGEQAGFSSQRDVTCRNYLGEDAHGFCALRITQARTFALQAAFEERAKLHPRPAKTMMKKAAAKQKPAQNLNLDQQQIPPPGQGPH
jgi:hypothetical protein